MRTNLRDITSTRLRAEAITAVSTMQSTSDITWVVAAYAGRIPGVDPLRLLRARLGSAAGDDAQSLDLRVAEVERGRQLICQAPRIILKPRASTSEVRVADLRARVGLPEDPMLREAALCAGVGTLTIEQSDCAVLHAARPEELVAVVNYFGREQAFDDIVADLVRGTARGYLWPEIAYDSEDTTVPAQISRLFPRLKVAMNWVEESIERHPDFEGIRPNFDACQYAVTHARRHLATIRENCAYLEQLCSAWCPSANSNELLVSCRATLADIEQLLERGQGIALIAALERLHRVSYSWLVVRDEVLCRSSPFEYAKGAIAQNPRSTIARVLVRAIIAMADHAEVADARIAALQYPYGLYQRLLDAYAEPNAHLDQELQAVALWCEGKVVPRQAGRCTDMQSKRHGVANAVAHGQSDFSGGRSAASRTR